MNWPSCLDKKKTIEHKSQKAVYYSTQILHKSCVHKTTSTVRMHANAYVKSRQLQLLYYTFGGVCPVQSLAAVRVQPIQRIR